MKQTRIALRSGSKLLLFRGFIQRGRNLHLLRFRQLQEGGAAKRGLAEFVRARHDYVGQAGDLQLRRGKEPRLKGGAGLGILRPRLHGSMDVLAIQFLGQKGKAHVIERNTRGVQNWFSRPVEIMTKPELYDHLYFVKSCTSDL